MCWGAAAESRSRSFEAGPTGQCRVRSAYAVANVSRSVTLAAYGGRRMAGRPWRANPTAMNFDEEGRLNQHGTQARAASPRAAVGR